MKKDIYSIIAFLTFVFFIFILISRVAYAQDKKTHQDIQYRPGELLVKFKSHVRQRGNPVLRSGLKPVRQKNFHRLGIEHWQLAEGKSVDEAIAELKMEGDVEYAEPNYLRKPYLRPNDPYLGQQWAFENKGQVIYDPYLPDNYSGNNKGIPSSDMQLASAWEVTTGDKGVVIAVIDDAIDIRHPDLAANIWINAGERPNNGIDDDGNGYVDDVNGWDFVNNDNDPCPDNPFEGHGTAVAGCAGAAGDNSTGITGVAWSVSIMPLKFNFDVASELAAIEYAIQNGAHIVNASWGGPQFSCAESGGIDLLEQAGILLVVSAGNNNGDNDLVPDYPSSLKNSNIIAVAGSTPDDHLISWSHYGLTTVDVAAPGLGIYTTMSSECSRYYGNSETKGMYYDYTHGTSFSSPYVAGVAALIKSFYPDADYMELKGRIMAGVEPLLTTPTGLTATDGRVNAFNSLTCGLYPVPVINEIQIRDKGRYRNKELDPGEVVDLRIILENVWNQCKNVSAILTTTDPCVDIIKGIIKYPDMKGGDIAPPQNPFRIKVARNVRAQTLISFQLEIFTGENDPIIRNFNLEVGTLKNNKTCNGILNNNPYDAFQLYYFNVPQFASNLNLSAFSNTGVDLLVRYGSPPQFDPYGYLMQNDYDPLTMLSSGTGGWENVNINFPTAGVYYVVVISYNAISSNLESMYSIKASYK
ncbi:S8 family serine peptidase [bacterium]|nr:S8 family serine peptidase [bacterium]